MGWLDALGWFGSALLVFSLLQAGMMRLRVLNTIACVILTVFNAVLGVWPMVAMNIVLALINIVFIVKMVRESDETGAYAVLAVPDDDVYLQHFLAEHAKDITTYFPGYSATADPRRRALLVQHGDETAGVVVYRDEGDGTAAVQLDYVTPKFRDFAPGKYVFQTGTHFRDRGFTRITTPAGMVKPYYDRLGFSAVGDHFELHL